MMTRKTVRKALEEVVLALSGGKTLHVSGKTAAELWGVIDQLLPGHYHIDLITPDEKGNLRMPSDFYVPQGSNKRVILDPQRRLYKDAKIAGNLFLRLDADKYTYG